MGEGSLNVTAMGLSVDVLVTGRTIHVPAAMTSNVFKTHFQFETVRASTLSETNTLLVDSSGFPSRILVRLASKQVSPEKSRPQSWQR